MNTGDNGVEKILNKVREQAVREFAEKLKTYLLLTCPGHMSVVSYEDIDNLVNRMYTEKGSDKE